ncbi:putative baseplate assembly protein [Nitrosospira sp. Nl5]|uniref:putative baseplate assembly protein n=1 Tax=Nitrosospira sp. Nl5 TaxID=200120 RepID=UPI00087FE839|nr:putative baseplate assembly protein [Nitrosospira sp. Nl5]SCX85639.1 putative baseplate assembly protein [Nitrosospira sp. Nl5]
MSIVKPPLIREESCSEREIVARVTDQLEERGFAPAGIDPLKDALVNVFARYCEILIERLNQVPESHHQAFLSMLGAMPAPAVPAQVPLSFTAVESTQNVTAIVPKSTQVSAPAENGSGPVVFETSKDLPLVRAELARAVAVDTQRLIHADVSSMVSTTSATGFSQPFLLTGAVPMESAMHIGQHAIIGLPGLTRLRLKIDLDHAGQLPPSTGIEWGIQSEAGFILLQPELDTTDGLTHSGELAFIPPEDWPSWRIVSETLPWLTCRLRPSATSWFAPNPAGRHSISIMRIEVSACASPAAIPVESAYHGGVPLDVSRDFFPLGERPRFGDVFYVLAESFAAAGARIVISIKLTNPAGMKDSPIPAVSSRGNPQLRWEGHTARGWVDLDCTDGTVSLTQDGEVDFLVPCDAVPATINGVKGGWVRARLVGGHYASDQPAGNDIFPPLNPPSIAAMLLASFSEFGPVLPEHLVVESNLEYRKIDPLLAQPFDPFPGPVEQGLMLYLALSSRNMGELAGHTVSLYAAPSDGDRRAFCRESTVDAAAAAPRWQARAGSGWHECAISDFTQGLSSPGIIEVRLPQKLSKWHESALDRQQKFFWLRLVWDSRGAEAARLPCPRRLLLNTVLASQTMRLENELLGSSNGRPGQVFHTLHTPIIGELMLEVREPGKNAGRQLRTGLDEESRYRFGSTEISTLPVNEAWVRWSGVEDFFASDSHSRHYIADRLTGSIRFGDGRNGRIPPPGANNIRLREYRAGGGRRGNRPAGAITRLHTTIPYVESVTNHEPAAGGQDKEDVISLSQGATARLRHRDRAVCIDDYADLARQASSEVAYAKCITARDLLRDPAERETETGAVSLIVVPYKGHNASRPQPSFELLKNVKAFLDARRPLGVDLIVLGPEYVSIDIQVEIAWAAGHSVAGAAAECENRLSRFLHPVTGGLDGHGWQFGQEPHASDIYSLLGAIEGLDHIRGLELRSREERPGLLSAGTFLICSGKHEIRLC